MNLFILDTDTVSLFQRNHPAVRTAVLSHPIVELSISVLTVEEQLSGWYSELRKAKNPPDLAAVYQRMTSTVKFFAALQILTFTEAAILRSDGLRQQKINIGKTDLRIAAVALDHDATLVTRNVRDFSRVPGLRIEDWSK